jgi:hypothetical protein
VEGASWLAIRRAGPSVAAAAVLPSASKNSRRLRPCLRSIPATGFILPSKHQTSAGTRGAVQSVASGRWSVIGNEWVLSPISETHD